jgi:transcriptional regulator with XRE-family HTH domain
MKNKANIKPPLDYHYIRKAIESRGLSMGEAAEMLGITRQHLNRLLRNKYRDNDGDIIRPASFDAKLAKLLAMNIKQVRGNFAIPTNRALATA